MAKNNDIVSTFLIPIAFAVVLLGGAIIFGFMYSLSQEGYTLNQGTLDVVSTGQVGDFIGGLVGAIWSLAGILLFYSALRIQRKALEKQSEELERQQESLRIQSTDLRNQQEQFAMERVVGLIYRQLPFLETAQSMLALPQQQAKGRDAIDQICASENAENRPTESDLGIFFRSPEYADFTRTFYNSLKLFEVFLRQETKSESGMEDLFNCRQHDEICAIVTNVVDLERANRFLAKATAFFRSNGADFKSQLARAESISKMLNRYNDALQRLE